MKKVNLIVKSCLISKKDEYNIKGNLENNKLIFFLEKTKMILLKDDNILIRENKEQKILLDFNNKICIVKDKTINKEFSFNIEVNNLVNTGLEFDVLYKIEQDEFKININIIDK